MRKYLYAGSICFFCLLFFFLSYIPRQKAAQAPAHVTLEAKVDGYSSLASVEEAVTIIVKAKKSAEAPPVITKNSRGQINFTGTIGTVTISKIYKNESSQNLAVGDSIPVFENETYDPSSNTSYHIAGYQKMAMQNEYLLFLNYSAQDKWYVPCSAIWGKYPLDTAETILFPDTAGASWDLENEINRIRMDAIHKYL